MASLRITEFPGIAVGQSGGMSAPIFDGNVVHQVVTIGAEVDSAALAQTTRLIRVQAEAICCIDIGPSPTNPAATVNAVRLNLGQTEYFGVGPGAKVSVITST